MRQGIRIFVLALASMAAAAAAAATADKPVVGPVPDWVQPAAAELAPGPASDAGVQVLLNDEQVRFAPDAVETYVDSRVRIQTPQGLQAIGTIAVAWQPDADVITVHRLIARRGTQVRDLLGAGEGFTVLRREDMLEQATLTGTLTAILQPADLQVGDIVEFSYTRRHADPVVPDKPDKQLAWANAPVQRVHFRAQWPKQMAIRWQLRDFKPALQEASRDGNQSIDFTLENPAPLLQPTGAPARYAALRRVELTAFQSWPEVSRRLAPLYAQASKLAADSPLHAEIDRIRAASTDPKARVAAALRLAQDQVRYVLLAMNDGALMPATADQTWQRRYGDCKAKTTLLLALLRELGIEAEPVVVNSSAGDGIDQLLPAISAFDHVLVRAQIAGKTYWLDGTRLGDRQLDQLQVPAFSWGLPLTARGGELVRIEPAPLTEPELVQEIHLDASAGVDVPAGFQAKAIFHGDGVVNLKLSLDNVDATQRDQGLRNYWRKQFDGLQPTKVAFTFDEANNTMTWTAEGTLPLDWSKDGFYELDNMRLGFKPDFTRPEGTDAEAPYRVSYPQYSVFRTSVKLPPGKPEFTISGDDIDKTIAGWQYQRNAQIKNAVFTAEASMRSVVHEISARDAHDAEAGLRDMYKNGLYIRKPEQPAPAPPLPSAAELQSQAGKPLATAEEYLTRGQQMGSRKLYELAVADFNHAIALDPKLARAYLNRGWSLEQLGRTDDALADYNKAHSLDPKDVDTLRYLGMLLVNNGRHREAIDLFSQALQQDDSAALHSMRASARMSAGQLEEALTDLAVVSKANPGDIVTYQTRALLLVQLKKPDAAREVAAEVLAAHAGPAEGVAIAAVIYDMAGDRTKARTMVDTALAKSPRPELYTVKAAFAANPEDTLADLEQALKLDPNFLQALQRTALVQFSLKKYPDLLQTLDRLDSVAPASSESRRMRGEALAMLGKVGTAQEAFSSARAMAHSGGEFNDLCWSEATTSDYWLEDALKDCDAATAKEPQSSAVLDSRGFVLLKLKRYDEAIASYDAAISRRPQQATSLYGRGIAKMRLGKDKEGEADISAAVGADSTIESRFKGYGVQR